MPVATGQIAYEASLLAQKLALRDPVRLGSSEWKTLLTDSGSARLNPVFFAVEGPVADWEKTRSDVGMPRGD